MLRTLKKMPGQLGGKGLPNSKLRKRAEIRKSGKSGAGVTPFFNTGNWQLGTRNLKLKARASLHLLHFQEVSGAGNADWNAAGDHNHFVLQIHGYCLLLDSVLKGNWRELLQSSRSSANTPSLKLVPG